MSDLDPRKQSILRAVVIEYVYGAEPVASEQLVQKYELGVRSATVRNELAEMADLGYLDQPHTSAGRIPSDKGYRYYVDRLIVRRDIQDAIRQQVRGAAREGDALQSLLGDTAKLLSRLTRLLAVGATVRDGSVKVLTAVLSALGPQQALLVLVLSNGQVVNRMVECPVGLTLTDVGKANEQLGAAIVGKGLRVLARAKAPAASGTPASDKLLAIVWALIRQICRDLTRGTVITAGEEYLFGQPEFQGDTGSLTGVLDRLIDSGLFFESLGDGPQVVTIGKENREPAHRFTVVRNSFFVGEDEAGVVAVVGPTRMDYDSSLPLVSFTADALSASLSRFFGK
jgi:heat-inducible transcriptional repressor